MDLADALHIFALRELGRLGIRLANAATRVAELPPVIGIALGDVELWIVLSGFLYVYPLAL